MPLPIRSRRDRVLEGVAEAALLPEELLGVRPALHVASAEAHELGNALPVFAELLVALDEQVMLLVGPAAAVEGSKPVAVDGGAAIAALHVADFLGTIVRCFGSGSIFRSLRNSGRNVRLAERCFSCYFSHLI